MSADMPDEEFFGDEDSPRAWQSRVIQVPAPWFEEQPPPRKWLLRDSRKGGNDGVIAAGKCAQLIAEGGAGKTLVAVSLAMACATGTKWLNTFDVTQGRCLLLMGEEDEIEARRRIWNVTRSFTGPKPSPDMLQILPLAGVPCAMIDVGMDRRIQDAPFLIWLREYLKRHKDWGLIIVDPLSRFAGPDTEKDAAAATRFVQALESISGLTGAAVLVAHHTSKVSRSMGKIDAGSSRGSSALVDGVRLQMALNVDRVKFESPEENERLGETVTLSFPKSNYSKKASELVLRRDLDNGGALLPLDQTDLDALAEARRAARDKGREKKGDDAADRKKLTAEREAEKCAESELDDQAAAEIIAANPDSSVRELVTLIKKKRSCGSTRAHDAITRIRLAMKSDGVPTE